MNEIYSLNEEDIFEVSKELSRGMLMGARGNSEVILSQLFRGISKGLEGKEGSQRGHSCSGFRERGETGL